MEDRKISRAGFVTKYGTIMGPEARGRHLQSFLRVIVCFVLMVEILPFPPDPRTLIP